MKIIGESSSTRTEWVLVDGDRIIEHAFTTGLNPYFQTRREISHSVRLELPETFFRRRWRHVYFYGAGCSNKEKKAIIESSLVAQFKTPVTVESDLLGAAVRSGMHPGHRLQLMPLQRQRDCAHGIGAGIRAG